MKLFLIASKFSSNAFGAIPPVRVYNGLYSENKKDLQSFITEPAGWSYYVILWNQISVKDVSEKYVGEVNLGEWKALVRKMCRVGSNRLIQELSTN